HYRPPVPPPESQDLAHEGAEVLGRADLDPGGGLRPHSLGKCRVAATADACYACDGAIQTAVCRGVDEHHGVGAVGSHWNRVEVVAFDDPGRARGQFALAKQPLRGAEPGPVPAPIRVVEMVQ